LAVGGIAAVRPGQLRPGSLGQQQPGHPYEGDEDNIWGESREDEVLGQLGAHHHHDQDRQDDRALEDHRLDGDSTQDVADGDI